MRIIPVIDLMAGQVVRGIAGRRDQYRPIQSRLATDSRPATVARAFAALGFTEAYVADLDAIRGDEPAWETYRSIASCGLDLWIDAGVSTLDRATQLVSCCQGVVVGLESLSSIQLLGECLNIVGPAKLIFSLDLRDGHAVSRIVAWQDGSAESIGRMAIDAGVRRMIVLDLARVGVNGGVGTEKTCRALRDYCPEIELTAGGGVRGIEDLAALSQAGCDVALVASALHDGRLPHLGANQATRVREPVLDSDHAFEKK